MDWVLNGGGSRPTSAYANLNFPNVSTGEPRKIFSLENCHAKSIDGYINTLSAKGPIVDDDSGRTFALTNTISYKPKFDEK